jgi:hypothetical protein
MKRGQVYVRAQSPSGRWHTADVLDLTEESFRVWLLDLLIRAQAVVSIRPDLIPTEHLDLRTTIEPPTARD